jgi:AP-3 complex subunit mu
VITASTEIEPLLALEFLHRVIDILEEFLGSPLLAVKIESSYDVVAQLLNEMCDAGAVSTTEPNALRDLVEVEGWIGKLLGGISLPGSVIYYGYKASKLMVLCSESQDIPHHQIRRCQAYLPQVHCLQTAKRYHGEGPM